MRQFLILGMIIFSLCVCAQVGIGTVSPNSNSILELSSPNKGLLLPRVTDTTVVSNPTAGLFLYNSNTKSPSFHDGQKWNSVAQNMMMPTSGADSLTYSFSGVNELTFNGEKRLENCSISGGDGPLSYSLTKYPDINSVDLMRRYLDTATIGTLEVKYYKNGTVYRSSKFGNIKLTSIQYGFIDKGLDGNGISTETYSFTSESYGYKDWINNQSFYYTFAGKIYGTY